MKLTEPSRKYLEKKDRNFEPNEKKERKSYAICVLRTRVQCLRRRVVFKAAVLQNDPTEQKKLGDSMTSESCVLIDIDDLQVTTYDDILLAIDELLELADIEENSGSYFTALDDIA